MVSYDNPTLANPRRTEVGGYLDRGVLVAR